MANDVIIHVRAKDDASKVIGGVEQKAKGLGSALGGVLKKGALAGGVALAGIGIASLKMGMDFEKSMAEVQTLMPDISEKAFGGMKKDILALSAEMGIATDKAVPALYQAISAGVPRENIMEFMTVASKAAIGGVTELETAVDGITSVINAYGVENISAAKAADIMFTGVKLGKTTFDELSGALFNVVPIAAASGVGFEQVTAALAALTAQGVPTATATTQLRAAIQALSAPTVRQKALMEELGLEFSAARLEQIGLSAAFKEAIDATGGNMEQLRKLIGSVEGLQAVLALGGEQSYKFDDALVAMGDSAKAVDEAFETVSETTAHKLGVAINNVKIILTKLGAEVLPVLVDFCETKLAPALQGVKRAMEEWLETMGPTIEDVGELKVAAEGLAEAIGNLDISIDTSEEGLGKFAGRNAALRIQIKMLTEVAEMWTALLEGRWLDALKNFVQVGLVPFQVGWETTRGVVATVIVGIARAVQFGLGSIIPVLQHFVDWVNAAIEGVNAFSGKIPVLGDKMQMSTIPAIRAVNIDLDNLDRIIRGTSDALIDFGDVNDNITNPALREFAGLNRDLTATLEDGVTPSLGDAADAAGDAAGGASDAQEAFSDLQDTVSPISEMFSILAGNIDAATSSLHQMLGIQTQEEAQLEANIALLDLEIEKHDRLAEETVTLSKAQEDNLYWWGRSLLMKQDSVTAIEDEIKALERKEDIEGELSKKEAERLRTLKEERDALEDSVVELEDKIEGLKILAGSSTDAGKAAAGLIKELEAERDVLKDDLELIDASKKATGAWADAQVDTLPSLDNLTGSILAQGAQLGLWGESIDSLPPHLRNWYQAHSQTVFDISLNFNHLLLAQSLFVTQSQTLADTWAAAWAEAGNAAFPDTSAAAGGSAVPVDSGRGGGWARARGMQYGGIVTRKTLALIGEAGPEAVIPLGRAGVGQGNITNNYIYVTAQGSILSERDLKKVIADGLRRGEFRGAGAIA